MEEHANDTGEEIVRTTRNLGVHQVWSWSFDVSKSMVFDGRLELLLMWVGFGRMMCNPLFVWILCSLEWKPFWKRLFFEEVEKQPIRFVVSIDCLTLRSFWKGFEVVWLCYKPIQSVVSWIQLIICWKSITKFLLCLQISFKCLLTE